MPLEPHLNAAVPIIGQQVYTYPLGHAALAFPLDPAGAMDFFQMAKGQGWQPDPGFVLLWVANAVQAQLVTQALANAQKRIEVLEQALGITAPEGSALVSVVEHTEDGEGEDGPTEGEAFDEPAGDLPDWARKAADATAGRVVVDDLVDNATCDVCGCTEADCSKCIEKTGAPCRWVQPGLCSACAPEHATEASDVG